jgi:hypothetical protein
MIPPVDSFRKGPTRNYVTLLLGFAGFNEISFDLENAGM